MLLAAALEQYLAQRAPGFDWDERHCGAFVAGWVRLVTGRDPLAGCTVRGHKGWLRAVTEAGGFAAYVTERLDAHPTRPESAQLGDVVLLPGWVTGGALGLCAGRTAAALDAEGRVAHVPMREARLAWPLSRMPRAEAVA